MNRRALLAGIVGVAATGAAGLAVAARPRRSLDALLRVGVMSNLTHAPLLAGLGSGRMARALAPTRIESRIFRAGPRVTEALIGDAIDVGTAGPAAVVIHHARHARGERGGLRVLGGCASGGASFVVRSSSNGGSTIAEVSDLHGKRLAVTQLGTTQDVALRLYLRRAGLRTTTAGGDVTVLAIAGATILEQMKQGELSGAWVSEPWATRIVTELAATRLVDERDLWPGRRFATAVLASRREDATAASMERFSRALEVEVARAIADPEASLAEAHAELKRHIGYPGPRSLFDRAAAFVDFTFDPIRESIEQFGETAASFGLCPPHPAATLFG